VSLLLIPEDTDHSTLELMKMAPMECSLKFVTSNSFIFQ